MDPLQQLAKSKFDFNAYKRSLKEKIDSMLVVTHNNGLFKVTPELISLVQILRQNSNDELIYLEDSYKNPIQANSKELLEQLLEAHQFAINSWWVEFEQAKKIRKLDV